MSVLTKRALNRATLARQMLLRRSDLPVPDALEQLVGLQAQTPHTWYTGLWTRLEDFHPESVSGLFTERQVVRIALMRSTIHLVTARDSLALRPVVQPIIERSMQSNHGKHLDGIDAAALLAAGRAAVDAQPLTFSELGRVLAQQWPAYPAAHLAQAIRSWVPLVQVPPRGLWGASGQAAHTSLEAWLGEPVASETSPDAMIRRYLAAFGPATVKDIQTWSGLTRLSEAVERLRPVLVTFRDEHDRELFDLPDAPRPDPDTPAPPRFLYDYDNVNLSHADRSRFRDAEPPVGMFTEHGPLPGTVLVDGFSHAGWRITRQRGSATLTVQPFTRLSKKDTAAVTEEGAGLLRFAAADADTHDIRFGPLW